MGIFDFFAPKKPAPKAPVRALPTPGGVGQRPAPKGKNNLIVITLDSCRFDSFVAADPKTILKLGPLEKRWSYASWTAPSHYNLLTGLLPHTTPSHVYASEYYKEDYLNYNRRLEAQDIEFAKMVPALWMPEFFQKTLGYTTHARVSLPVLNERTGINRNFDSFQLMAKHNDMRSMLPTMKFSDERPAFYMLNVGETHYPFALPDEDSSMWPRISGVNGVLKKLDAKDGGDDPGQFFDDQKMAELRQRQIHTVEYLDGVFQELFDLVPKNTYVIVTADHGELFGELGYFGHGPIMHEKVFEVPYLEGKIR
jgi:hypothetical protein